MKWIVSSCKTLGLSFRYLLRRDQGLREDSIVVVPLSGFKPDIDRNINRPWHPLPNVRKFKIEIRPFDWLFLLFGLRKRVSPKMKFYTWKNAPMNRYVDYMFKRLHKLVKAGLYKKAYKTLKILMRNSVAYRIVAYNHVCHNWHRNKPLWLVKQQLIHVTRLCKKMSTMLVYHRAYIPKGETWRPLGVPEVAWRVYLHMLNNIIVEWRMVTEGNSQHGFIPGRGILTAWRRLFKLLKYPYVYEIDYKQFFDRVNLLALRSQMVRLGFPEKFADLMYKINKFPMDIELMKLNELPSMSKLLEFANQNPEFKFRKMSKLVQMIVEIYRGTYNGPPINLSEVVSNAKGLDKIRMSDVANTMFGMSAYSIYGIRRSNHGVPQGAPTSCSLSTLILRIIEERLDKLNLKVVAYADDVIIAGKTEFDPRSVLEDQSLGLTINWDKSGWVKYDGIWRGFSQFPIRDRKSNEWGIKFLGVRYCPSVWVMIRDYIREWNALHPRPYNISPFRLVEQIKEYRRHYHILELLRPKWKAETRNGARLEFTLKISFLAYLAKARNIAIKYINSPYVKQFATIGDWLKHCDSKWSVLWDQVKSSSHSPIFGWIMSRMQNDTWNTPKVKQEFAWSCTRNSWAAVQWNTYRWEQGYDTTPLSPDQLTIFTSASFACHDMANWLTWKGLSKSR